MLNRLNLIVNLFRVILFLGLFFIFVPRAEAVDPCAGGTLGYWSMTENSGNVIHDSCNGYNGTWTQGVGWASDDNGSYLQFSGGNGDRIRIPYPSLAQNTSTTVELMMMPGTLGNRVISQMRPDPFVSGDHLRFTLRDSASALQVWGATGDGTFGFCDSAPCLPSGQWTHVAFQINGTQIKLFYNGVLVKTATLPYPQILRATDAITEIGSGEGIFDFDGRIQYVRISQGVRNDFLLSRVQPPPPPPPPPAVDPCAGGTLGYWSMTEGTGTTVNDQCHSYNGTWTQGVSWANDAGGPYLQFYSGNGTRIVIPHPILAQNTSTTVELMMMSGSLGNRVLSQMTTFSGENNLRYTLRDSGNALQIWGSSGDGTFSFCGAQFCYPEGQWTHVAFQINGTDVKMYLNGNLVRTGTMPYPQSLRVTNAYTEIGSGEGIFDFDGRIQYVRISQGIRGDFLLSRNQPSTADAGGPYFVVEGDSVALTGSGSDPNGDPLTYAWDLDSNGTYETTGQSVIFPAANADGPSIYPVVLQVCDNHGACATASNIVSVTNASPTADFTANPATFSEGGVTTLTFSQQFDPGTADTAAGFVYSFDCTNDGSFEAVNNVAAAYDCRYLDNGSYTSRGRIKDKDGGFTDYFANFVVDNVAPMVGTITAPTDPLPVNSTVNASASFTDPGVLDTHTAVWDWGDGTTDAGTVGEGSGSVTGSHTYTTAGTYVVMLSVTDNDGGTGQNTYSYVVIFDSTAGFVTGAGMIDSPAGAFPQNPTLTGKANFGFSVKYLPGDYVPNGGSQFRFRLAEIDFSSTSYQWLVISGAKAVFQGTGTNNGSGNYVFLVSTIDGLPDRYRMIIRNAITHEIFYDNEVGSLDLANPTTPLLHGNVVIH